MIEKPKLCETCAKLFAGQVIYVKKHGFVLTGEVHTQVYKQYHYIRSVQPKMSQTDVIEYLVNHSQYTYETIRSYISHKPECFK